MKYFLSILLVFVFLCSSAQLRIGAIGGFHSSTVNESNQNTYFNPYFKSLSSGHGGLIFDIPFSDDSKWSLQPALLLMVKGRVIDKKYDSPINTNDTISFNQKFKSSYIEFPLHINRNFSLGKNSRFFIGAGPYFSAFMKGEAINAVATNQNPDPNYNFPKTEKIPHEVGNAPHKIKTVDYGLSARAGISFKTMFLSAFYSHGLKDFYTYTFDNKSKYRVAGASIGFWLNKVETKVKDTDADGIPDDQDGCPFDAGSATLNGCPDLDQDGIADKDDACPGIAGIAKYNGCPIPDSDGDGINDEEDACPNQPGISKYKGCPVPDSDGDGLDDENDDCPSIAGPIANKGCPWKDTDGDGIPDKDDACPLTPGIESLKGCAPIEEKVLESVKHTAANIYFETASDQLKKTSFVGLNNLVEILKKDSNLILTIAGHTDNVGLPENNLKLSERRALTVKNYLISQGIDANRIKHIGYGDTRPIASNTTNEGKAKNRRVEIELNQQ